MQISKDISGQAITQNRSTRMTNGVTGSFRQIRSMEKCKRPYLLAALYPISFVHKARLARVCIMNDTTEGRKIYMPLECGKK